MPTEAAGDLVSLLDLISRMTQSIEGEKTTETNAHAQTLAVKTFLHLGSALYLASGTKLPHLTLVREGIYCDFASIAVLTRAALESYINLCFLFVSPPDALTQELRVEGWRLSALLARQRFPNPSPERRKQIDEDRAEIATILARLEANPHFLSLPEKHRSRLRDGQWRAPYSWEQLAENFAWIPGEIFRVCYGLLSSYAHADYLSAMHIDQAGPATRRELTRHLLVQARMVASYLVFAYAWMFETPRHLLATATERSLAQRYCLSLELIGVVRSRS